MSPQYNRLTAAVYGQEQQTDQAIARRVEQRLRDSTFVAIRGLTCDVHEGMLTLRGRVPNFYTKQVALTLISEVPGVEEIADRVEVA